MYYTDDKENFKLEYDSDHIATAPHVVIFVVGVLLTLLLLFFKTNRMQQIRSGLALVFWAVYIAVTVRMMP